MNISLDKIHKHELGTRYKLITKLNFDYPIRGKANYQHEAYYCLPKKRTWHPLTDTNCYKFRDMSMNERSEKQYRDIELSFGKQFIHEAKLELWNSIKPIFN